MSVLTEFCDIFGAINEQAFNKVIADVQNQRPSLFNYGTVSFVNKPALLCDSSVIARIDPDVKLFNNPFVSPLSLLSIPGYSGPFGLEYCFQLSKVAIDFQPSNAIQLPPGLDPPLKNQTFTLQASISAGLGIPDAAAIQHAAATIPSGSPAGPPTIPFLFTPNSLGCFSLDIFAVFNAQQGGTQADSFISLALDGLELPEIMPAGLESIIESYLKTVLSLAILPKVKLALSSLVLNIADLLTISPTTISANVPFNPSIEKDQIEVFLTLN